MTPEVETAIPCIAEPEVAATAAAMLEPVVAAGDLPDWKHGAKIELQTRSGRDVLVKVMSGESMSLTLDDGDKRPFLLLRRSNAEAGEDDDPLSIARSLLASAVSAVHPDSPHAEELEAELRRAGTVLTAALLAKDYPVSLVSAYSGRPSSMRNPLRFAWMDPDIAAGDRDEMARLDAIIRRIAPTYRRLNRIEFGCIQYSAHSVFISAADMDPLAIMRTLASVPAEIREELLR